jgi:hypothetical protein
MDTIRRTADEKIKQFKELRKLRGEEFRTALIKLTRESQGLASALKKVRLDGILLSDHKLFLQKKQKAQSFCEELFSKTQGKVTLNLSEILIVPNKLNITIEELNSLKQKENLTPKEISDLINIYKRMFESIKILLEPHFKSITQNEEYLEWSEMIIEINKFDENYQKLFSSMNGQLRNAIAHESTYLEQNKLIWITEDKVEKEYPLIKIYEKIYDLIFLILSLYCGFEAIHLEKIITFYGIAPIDKLKESVDHIFQ